jgi:hypothetical protein
MWRCEPDPPPPTAFLFPSPIGEKWNLQIAVRGGSVARPAVRSAGWTVGKGGWREQWRWPRPPAAAPPLPDANLPLMIRGPGKRAAPGDQTPLLNPSGGGQLLQILSGCSLLSPTSGSMGEAWL